MKRIAVIGSGISGLSAAYYLSRRHEVFLFEKNGRLGGHTQTVEVETSKGLRPIDTGFIVHNDRTYPNLVRLLDEIGVRTIESDMSFAVTSRRDGYEYSSRGLSGFFATRSNLFRWQQYGLLREILRFNREAPGLFGLPGCHDLTLRDFLDAGHYSAFFRERYLYPMASAVWSMPFEGIERFPASTLIRFFDNHGMLGIDTHPTWRVLAGGSHSYLPGLTAPLGDRIFLGSRISSVRRDERGVSLQFLDRPAERFDEVVLAVHGDQVLPLLESPSDAERDVFGSFRTSRNDVCLHTDESLLPRRADARASWNYSIHDGEAEDAVTVTYHMNRLQRLDVDEDYCVTLNANGSVDPAKVIRRMVYHHPVYDRAATQAQSRWSDVSGRRRTHYCGAYWFDGFHEDGLNSGLRVARALEVDC